MTETTVGYVGVEHHHRDPYFQIADQLGLHITSVCEPGDRFDPSSVEAMTDRPDEITAETVDVRSMLTDATVYRDPTEMLQSEPVDVLWITYSNRATPTIIETAVAHGVDVISEKPLARTAAELEPVAETAADTDVTIGVTYFYRGNPVARALKERVTDGFFGDMWAIDARYVGSKLDYRNTDHYIYQAEQSRGGVLQWIGLHWIDLCMWILDDPIHRVCMQRTDAAIGGIEEGVALVFETNGGVMGTFQTGYYLGELGKDSDVTLYGTHGTAQSPVHDDARQGGGSVPLRLSSDRAGWRGAPRRTIDYEFGYDRLPSWGDYVLDFFREFFHGRGTAGGIPADIDDALRVLRVLDAAYESAETGDWITVAPAD